jgi:hypothetical protein
VAALGCESGPPPDGYDTWDGDWRAVGVSELGLGLGRIVGPAGRGARIWFQVVPEKKTLKNRLHLDITVSGAGRGILRRPEDQPASEADDYAGFSGCRPGRALVRVFEGRDSRRLRPRSAELRRAQVGRWPPRPGVIPSRIARRSGCRG